MIYLDNNATTLMPQEVIAALNEWCNRGNPSASYASAKSAKNMMRQFREFIAKLCEIRTNCGRADCNDPLCYLLVFTSGASESNATIVNHILSSCRNPHIICSAVEHKSVISPAQAAVDRGQAELTLITPTFDGNILADDIAAAVVESTRLVCIMHANNETGAINPITDIGRMLRARGVFFHVDAVQTFGKYPLKPVGAVDSFSVSFHKFGGPPGIGLLAVRHGAVTGENEFVPLIFGSQNGGLRGGTENLPGIGASFAALKIAMNGRPRKNNSISEIKSFIVTELARRIPACTYSQYMTRARSAHNAPEIEIVFLSGVGRKYLENTILLSVVKRTPPLICNTKMKDYLESKRIIVSVGSACNTDSAKASHVLYALGADELIRKGALRISLGDNNTLAEANIFVREFVGLVAREAQKK